MTDYKLYVRGYKGTSFFSKLIKRFTFGEYSHVSLVFKLKDRWEEIEAIEGKGVVAHAPKEEGNYTELLVPISREKVIDAHITAISMLNAGYDWTGIWGFLVRKTKHSVDKWFCSEYASYVLLKSKYPISRREPYQESPQSVMDSLRLVEEG